MPAFPGKDVVSAASRQRVHGFQADAQAHQPAEKRWRHKAQTRAAAKDHQFRAKAGNFFKMTGRQVFKALAKPVLALATRAYKHAAVDFFSHPLAGESDPAWAIAKDGLNVKAIWLEFHAARISVAGLVGSGCSERGPGRISQASGRLVPP